MRKIFFFIVIFLILTIGTFFVSSKQSQIKVSQDVYDSLDHVEKVRVIIKLQKPSQEKGFLIKTQKTALEINLEKQEIKESVLNEIKKENVKHVFDDSISVIISLEELNKLEKNNYVTEIKLVGLKQIFLQDSVPLINASVTWPVQINTQNLSGIDETICIIDTGIYYNHSDFGNCYGNNNASSSCKILGGWDFCTDDVTCTSQDSNPLDVHGHGTHVAGIAAANGSIKGVAPNARIIMIKAANSSGSLWDDDIRRGIDWCVDNASEFNISVISMSLGGGLYSSYCDGVDDSSDITLAINNAVSQNISVVISTGNDGNTTHISSPACIQNAIPVGASTKSDGIASYSNRNNLTNLFAPGSSINATFKGGSCPVECTCVGNYMICSGTSMSAPHVSGAIALINQFLKLSGQMLCCMINVK